MADVAAYDSLLAEVIKAPRLSGSKVKTLTELALSLVQHDTHLVTALYKQFKARPSKSTQRISALYVFDAIARAARSAAKANKSRAKEPGTPGSLLSKMEGVVDGIVDGMVEDGWKEGRDKLRKVSDIWQKAGTFSTSAIERVQSKISAANTPPPVEEEVDDGPSYASVEAAAPPAGIEEGSKVAASGALPASIMALLGKQAQGQNGASPLGATLTSNSTPPPVVPVDIAALLANVSKVVLPAAGTPPQLQQQQYQQAAYPQQPAYPQQQQQQYPSYSQQPPYQQAQAGPSRQRSPPPILTRPRDPRERERSRSPQRRDPRSPPRRDSRTSHPVDPRVARDPRAQAVDPRLRGSEPADPRLRANEGGDPRFRAETAGTQTPPVASAPASLPVSASIPVASQPQPSPHVPLNTTPPAPSPAASSTTPARVTLQTFDFKTFDGTKPESWVALAEAWTNTTGAEPNQMQLMMFISTGQIVPNPQMGMGMGRGMGVGRF